MASGSVGLRQHFTQRMDERGMMWADIQAVFDDPTSVRDDGLDDAGRERWIVTGGAADHAPLTVVCTLHRSTRGDVVGFITLFWED